jgi:protoporphyrin/coproporphyrin ferrochelatase
MAMTAILLMAYGTPNSLDEIEPYYTDIRGGRKPSPENLRELIERYQRIGGHAVSPTDKDSARATLKEGENAGSISPLLDITRAQAQALQEQLGGDFRVYVGMKHWHPYIAEAVDEIVRDGPRQVIALALAPHYSRFSIDGYIQRVRDAIQKTGATLNVTFVESWNDHPLFLKAVAEKMEAARRQFGAVAWEDIQVIFSAHSLPERILQSNDPYPRELQETCEGVARLLGLKREGWRFAYQSAGRTGEKWLGPDILDTLDRVAAEGCKRVLIAPIGFVADHLEVLYDIDVECAERAHALGLELRRIESPNANPTFIAALAALVREQVRLTSL